MATLADWLPNSSFVLLEHDSRKIHRNLLTWNFSTTNWPIGCTWCVWMTEETSTSCDGVGKGDRLRSSTSVWVKHKFDFICCRVRVRACYVRPTLAEWANRVKCEHSVWKKHNVISWPFYALKDWNAPAGERLKQILDLAVIWPERSLLTLCVSAAGFHVRHQGRTRLQPSGTAAAVDERQWVWRWL